MHYFCAGSVHVRFDPRSFAYMQSLDNMALKGKKKKKKRLLVFFFLITQSRLILIKIQIDIKVYKKPFYIIY